METLVVVAQHRNQYYSRSKHGLPGRFVSSPSRGFREINCRTFQSGAGISPNLLKSYNGSSAIRRTSSSPPTPPSLGPRFEEEKQLKSRGKSSAIPINLNASNKDTPFNDGLSYSELWAGPAYSNSPPPSSLPIPKFSLRQKRSVSLDLPSSGSRIPMHPIAKSAPPSPTREPYPPRRDFFLNTDFAANPSPRDFFLNIDSATKDLRRMLHLDVDDERERGGPSVL
ncbi:PREDICTED: uncharacterized protein LOC104596558 [Nelumbo nucifera]|uniref:Uncharacterized protein LOC104596558 n=1 Tax=Nelumbo nucifera TaxID=4432 RepID=A0A1U8A320_NELNU|nr:PREDICTED: uncharacterized protein LOC104596558 [Nelumbo nucifera]